MSQENVELVPSLYAAAQRRDYHSPFELIDEDIVWDISGFALPDMAKLYAGRNRGRASGVAVDFHYFQVSTVRKRKVTASYMAETRVQVLEAAELSE